MPITRHNLAAHELIGLELRVVHAASRPLVGLHGRIVDETRNTLVIETPKRTEKTVPKLGARFAVRLPSGETVELDGDKLAIRPADRAKRLGHASK